MQMDPLACFTPLDSADGEELAESNYSSSPACQRGPVGAHPRTTRSRANPMRFILAGPDDAGLFERRQLNFVAESAGDKGESMSSSRGRLNKAELANRSRIELESSSSACPARLPRANLLGQLGR